MKWLRFAIISNEYHSKEHRLSNQLLSVLKGATILKEQKTRVSGAIQSVQFSPIQEQSNAASGKSQIQLLTDVSLQVSFELGRTAKTVRELLQLKTGSIIGLDKLAGEYVDVLVNNQTIALGEVVVMDDKFAVRITEVISDQEKEKKMR
jgi:flagellar motor switch protein FliN